MVANLFFNQKNVWQRQLDSHNSPQHFCENKHLEQSSKTWYKNKSQQSGRALDLAKDNKKHTIKLFFLIAVKHNQGDVQQSKTFHSLNTRNLLQDGLL